MVQWVQLMRCFLLAQQVPLSAEGEQLIHRILLDLAKRPDIFRGLSINHNNNNMNDNNNDIQWKDGDFPEMVDWKVLALFQDTMEAVFHSFADPQSPLDLLLAPFLSRHVPVDFAKAYWTMVGTFRRSGFWKKEPRVSEEDAPMSDDTQMTSDWWVCSSGGWPGTMDDYVPVASALQPMVQAATDRGWDYGPCSGGYWESREQPVKQVEVEEESEASR